MEHRKGSAGIMLANLCMAVRFVNNNFFNSKVLKYTTKTLAILVMQSRSQLIERDLTYVSLLYLAGNFKSHDFITRVTRVLTNSMTRESSSQLDDL